MTQLKSLNIKKEDVVDTILSVCKDMDLPVETNVKKKTWKADVVVDYDKYKVAFNVYKCPPKVEETYLAMRKERICGCWLILPTIDNKYSDANYLSPNKRHPCFPLFKDGNISVLLRKGREENTTLFLSDFISAIIQGKIKFTETTKVKYVDVRFYKDKCWKCGRENDLYFVYKSISDNGIEIDEGIDTFAPALINGIRTFIKEHPERNIILGQIKPRYSKTTRESYMSFGCAYCDSLFGKFFQDEDAMEWRYFATSLPNALIEIKEDIVIPANCWYKVEY